MTRAKIDPELLRQFAAASGPVEAVVQLRSRQPDQDFATPEETEALAAGLVERIERSTGLAHTDIHVFRNLSSFVIRAPVDLLVRLSEEPEVRAVVANRQPGSALIPPRNVRPARPPTPRKRRERS